MLEIKLQLGCLVILLYTGILYTKETQNFPCNKLFDALLFVAPWAIVFDAISYLTVNHMDMVPAWVNYGVHILLYIFMIATLSIEALHLYDKISGVKNHPKIKWLILLPGAIAIILATAGIGKVQFIQGQKTSYSMGFSVYVCFACVFLYYITILVFVLLKHQYLSKQKRFGVISYITLVGLILIAQIIFPEILITSLAVTVLFLGDYMQFENPSIRKMEIQTQQLVDSFASMVESRDNSTGGHIKRTRMYVNLLLKKMQQDSKYFEVMTVDYINSVSEAAPLHDIGKISTPDSILQKPGKLTDEEFEIMKKHTVDGGKIIKKNFGELKTPEEKQIAYEVARYHHEKYNGRGYPDGLAGENIPLHARVMAIADVFDAISQKRCYREAMPLEQCFEIIEKGAGSDFDPHLVELFLEDRDILSEMCVINREL
ncbi:MAG: HD domain-containing protein [Spirochaetia bacterium]|nr:HD domain-containing protein [Spirochaetia bacterium]